MPQLGQYSSSSMDEGSSVEMSATDQIIFQSPGILRPPAQLKAIMTTPEEQECLDARLESIIQLTTELATKEALRASGTMTHIKHTFGGKNRKGFAGKNAAETDAAAHLQGTLNKYPAHLAENTNTVGELRALLFDLIYLKENRRLLFPVGNGKTQTAFEKKVIEAYTFIESHHPELHDDINLLGSSLDLLKLVRDLACDMVYQLTQLLPTAHRDNLKKYADSVSYYCDALAHAHYCTLSNMRESEAKALRKITPSGNKLAKKRHLHAQITYIKALANHFSEDRFPDGSMYLGSIERTKTVGQPGHKPDQLTYQHLADQGKHADGNSDASVTLELPNIAALELISDNDTANQAIALLTALEGIVQMEFPLLAQIRPVNSVMPINPDADREEYIAFLQKPLSPPNIMPQLDALDTALIATDKLATRIQPAQDSLERLKKLQAPSHKESNDRMPSEVFDLLVSKCSVGITDVAYPTYLRIFHQEMRTNIILSAGRAGATLTHVKHTILEARSASAGSNNHERTAIAAIHERLKGYPSKPGDPQEDLRNLFLDLRYMKYRAFVLGKPRRTPFLRTVSTAIVHMCEQHSEIAKLNDAFREEARLFHDLKKLASALIKHLLSKQKGSGKKAPKVVLNEYLLKLEQYADASQQAIYCQSDLRSSDGKNGLGLPRELTETELSRRRISCALLSPICNEAATLPLGVVSVANTSLNYYCKPPGTHPGFEITCPKFAAITDLPNTPEFSEIHRVLGEFEKTLEAGVHMLGSSKTFVTRRSIYTNALYDIKNGDVVKVAADADRLIQNSCSAYAIHIDTINSPDDDVRGASEAVETLARGSSGDSASEEAAQQYTRCMASITGRQREEDRLQSQSYSSLSVFLRRRTHNRLTNSARGLARVRGMLPVETVSGFARSASLSGSTLRGGRSPYSLSPPKNDARQEALARSGSTPLPYSSISLSPSPSSTSGD